MKSMLPNQETESKHDLFVKEQREVINTRPPNLRTSFFRKRELINSAPKCVYCALQFDRFYSKRTTAALEV